MKKEVKNIISNNINLNNTSINDTYKIRKSIKIESFIRLFLSLIFFIILFVYYDKLMKVSIISSDTILNHHVFFSPHILYLVVLSLALFLNIVMFISSLLKLDILKQIKVKIYFLLYKIYDLISFICSIIIIIGFIILFLITPVTISGNSMNNTLKDGDLCLIYHFLYEPKLDDIIILDAYNYTRDEKFYVKRIVAVEGQKLSAKISEEHIIELDLYLNDELLIKNVNLDSWKIITNNDFDFENLSNNYFIIPTNKYLIFGDNHLPSGSYDSKNFGLVDKSDIIGKVVFRYYPFKDFGIPEKEFKEEF